MNPTTILRYLEIMLVSVITFIIIIATSITLSGLVFHNGHSHIYLEREIWGCTEYAANKEPIAFKEQDCIKYQRKF